MRRLSTFAITAMAAGLAASAALAADPIMMPMTNAPAVPVADYNAGFDWTGFYAGVYGVGQNSPVGGVQYGAGVALGANVAFDYFLLGGEIAVHGLTGGAGDTSYIQALGKAGVIVTDNVVVYAAAGYGFDLGPPAEDDLLLGGGVEVGVMENVSLRAQYLHGFPINGGNPKDQFTIGANFHF